MAVNGEQQNGTLVTITDEEDVPKFTQIIAAAFANDQLNRYIFLGRDSRPDHPNLSKPELRMQHWLGGITLRFKNGGLLVRTEDWSAAALWFPPGIKKPVPTGTVPEGAIEYREKFDAMKKKYLGDRKHWYLNLLGRDPSSERKGAVRSLLEPVLQQARDQNVPVWLETTNLHAKGVYEYFGFKTLEDVKIGKGIVDEDGWVKDGGGGVTLWGMILEP